MVQGSLRRVASATLAIRALSVALAGLLLAAVSAAPAQAGRRVALVVGNSDYRNVPPLPNPSRDANAIAAMFKRAGFDLVEAHVDLKYLEFTRALRRFEDAAEGADVAVIYYAGHGIEIGGTNYLIPVNAKLARDRDAEDEAIPLDRLVQTAEPAQLLRLIILDACRDNPFTRSMKRYRRTRAVRQGLGKIAHMGSNTLVAYAAKAGSTAEDGVGEHSPFTLALLKNLVVPGLDIRLAFGRVRDDVLRRTANRQEPFVYGSLGGSNVSLVPLAPTAPVVPPASVTEARGDYKLVEQIGTKKAWEVFLATHKTGLYADLARAQLAKIAVREARQRARPRPQPPSTKVAAAPSPPQAPPASAVKSAATPVAKPAVAAKPPVDARVAALEPQSAPPSAPPVAEDARAWELIKNSSDPAKFREFIARYPESVLSLTAQKHLSALEDAAREREHPEPAPAAPAIKPEASPPAVNTPELVTAAQEELERVGCFDGSADGRIGPVTRAAIKRYLAASGRSGGDAEVTGDLVAKLKKEKARVCPLQCARGEVVKGERCVAVKQKPEREAHRDRRKSKRTKQAVRPRPRQEASRQRRPSGGISHAIGVGF